MTAEKVLDSSTLDAVDNAAAVGEKVVKAAASNTAEVISETLDAVDETLEAIERIPSMNLNGTTKKQQVIIFVTVGLVSVAAGAVAAHFLTKRGMQTKYEKIVEDEVDKARVHYSKLNKVDPESGEELDPIRLAEKHATVEGAEAIIVQEGYSKDPGGVEAKETDPVRAARQNAETLESLRKSSEDFPEDEAPSEPTVVESHNVFRDARSANSVFDYGEEIPHRTADKPYIISQDEFDENEHEFENVAFSYFEEDDVLVNEREQIINDHDALVGNDALLNFGKGAKDRNTVHVRNERLGLDMEIVKSNGSYVREVMGVDTERLQHSNEPRVRKFRQDRD